MIPRVVTRMKLLFDGTCAVVDLAPLSLINYPQNPKPVRKEAIFVRK
jgi:hypothetical protein